MISQKLPVAKKRQAYSVRQQRIFDFLNGRYVGVLSSVTPDNNPHGAVVYYAIDRDFNVHILTRTGTHKYDNLVHNEHVMLTVYDPETQTTAQIVGRATERPGMRDINRVAGITFAKLGTDKEGMPPIMKLQAGEFTTFQIQPVQIRIALYARPISGGYEDLFESIESFTLKDA